MGQQKFCPDKQQYNNAFPVHAVTIEEIENSYGICFKHGA